MNKSVCILFILSIFTFSCGKDDDKDRDNIPPVVTLIGNSTDNLTLNSAYSDQGATATDNADGSLAVTSDFSLTNPNLDSVGSYIVKYTAKDNNGNKGYGYRTVNITNEAQTFEGIYDVTSISNGDTIYYTQSVWIDKNLNNRIHFSDLGNYSNNTHIYATINSNGLMSIPLQYAVNIGTDVGGSCDVVNHSFESIIGSVTSDGFTFEYVDAVTVPSVCMHTDTVVVVFVKQ